MLFWGQLSRENLLFGEEDEDEVEDEQVETSTHVTYCLSGDEEGEGCPKESGGGHHSSPGPSAPPSASSYPPACCHAPATAFYAILGLSRCWWQYTVTSSPGGDAMEEGVATERRVGGTTAAPEVTGVGWSLPCSLSSLLAMNCRARAEELARRLQSRVKVGTGGGGGGGHQQALEHTSLVSPTPDGPYSSMECRHSSLDEPYLEHLGEHNLRPIHVVTSEPTLHLHLPPPPPPAIKNMREQDSDVYYDFDLASPDDEVVAEVAEEEEEGEDKQRQEGKSHSLANGDRPESGCVTSVTSPLMFDEDGDEVADGDDPGLLGVSRDHFSPHDSMVCSPDADLMAVRNILSATSSLQQQQQDKRSETFAPRQRFPGIYTGGDEETGGVVGGDNNGQINASCDKICDSELLSCGWEEEEEQRDVEYDERPGAGSRGDYSRSDSAFSEGATDGVDKWHHHHHHHTHEHHEGLSGQVTMPVANSGSCWCHTADGTEPVSSSSSHLPTSPDPYSATAAVVETAPVSSEQSESVIEHTADDASGMTDDEDTERYAKEGHRKPPTSTGPGVVTTLHSPPTHFRERLVRDLSSDAPKHEDQPGAEEEEEEEELGGEEEELEEEEEVTISKSSVEEATAVAPGSISGATPPLLSQPHLYVPSEGQPAAMEARTGSEGDLGSKDEVFSADSDNEVIETLGDEEEGSDNDDEEENEEDIEEEAILTGKFRNIRQYTERVRRLSDDVEDRPPPPVEVKLEEEAEDPKSRALSGDDDDQASVSDVSSQLAQLDVDVEVEPPEEDLEEGDEEEEATPSESRSSSEETDPSRIEDFKMRIKRSSSLKCGKTPPGTPGRKKIVRFADVLGLDLAAVRTFLAGVPHVPRSAFWDLEVDREAAAKQGATATAPAGGGGGAPVCMPRRVLTPLFQQPGSHPDFIDRVRHQKVVIENVVVGDDMSVKGVVRVLSMDFHKSVSVRYTFDQWRNFHEATATYVPNSHDGATDRFSFLLWGSFLQDNGALAFCVRYCTLGQEFWDNNYGRNYTLQCYSSLGMPGEPGTNPARPQNSSNVQQFMQSTQNTTQSGTANYHSFGSPVTPSDPWASRFF
ncbi:uncharacterized protein LOC135203603 isoform X2 [Macrobrachium nipponense]|uniref:uncharacterized protein LOC135203603 isoform X2 n=1 Tax=Macrobrachium nipponense TaxID=159736 RepID=UPI0030C87936